MPEHQTGTEHAAQGLPPVSERPDLKTPGEHLQFLKDFAQVKFVFLYHRLMQAGRDESQSLPQLERELSFLVNLTTLSPVAIFDERHCSDEAAWTSILEDIEGSWRKTQGENSLPLDAASYAVSVLDKLGLFDGRVDRDLEDLHGGKILANFKDYLLFAPRKLEAPGSIREQADQAGLASLEGLEFHVANAAYPRSFFEDQALVKASFAYLIQRTRETESEIIFTTTWLNSLPKWNALFPSQWRDNLGPAILEVGPHLGCWGQFISSRQALNRRTAAELLRSGRFPYPMRFSWCRRQDVEAMYPGT